MLHEIFLKNKHYKDINPFNFGHQDCAPGHAFGPAIRHYYLLHYVLDGEGIFTNCAGTHKVKKGEFFVIRPNEVTTYTADMQNPWHYVWIGFHSSIPDQTNCFPKPVIDYKGNLFYEMMECENQKNMIEEFLIAKLFLLFAELLSAEPVEKDYCALVINYVRSNYMYNIKVEDIADSIHLNRRYLSRLFKEKIGKTIKEYIMDVRMKKAAELLSTRPFTVSEVSVMVGYEDVFNFSKMFKKFHKASPKDWSKK